MPKIVDAAQRRQEIVGAVCRIIATDGLEGASLREVADEAGLAVGSVRHYFESSDDLLAYSFTAVSGRILTRLNEALTGLGPAADGADEDLAVLTLLGEFLPLDEERALDACAWLAFRNAARTRPFLAAEADRSHRAVAAVVGQVINRLVREQDATADDAGPQLVTAAEHLLATLDGLAMHALLQPGWMSPEMCRDVLELHIEGLRRRVSANH
ncbi:TetR family transcriptional regulator C-terminal domain-containing protein [Arthrobacter sp. FW305-BF8]|uniref:TetR/AcrR family transcriptional regulator n=1 Tax=Arthrobacter sp. FW305-BF8 TaxID=2879617 RepID=UPI001F2A3ACA|nr:TetR family transcriptional regulator C-terminal domain-containing protein [Arthrobacter sp. FW305-BF8]UKA53063.1 TetR family transcriptional regulator C-terminal domain-containing protein [Arthrobacter sp. FW305-BF8]